ncbi:MAG: hypothetical protein ACKOQM_06600 [Novosphingobium sp.]
MGQQPAKTKISNGKSAYLDLFPTKEVRAAALERAHIVRTFEIDLYWKRATYFWTIIAVAFAGFFACENAKNDFGASFVASVGMVLGTAWYVVNRGGNAWHHNWEQHVDLLEDDVTGPLYKTLLNRKKYRFWRLTEPFPFSPSRANALVSIFVMACWLLLQIKAFIDVAMSPSVSQIDALFAVTMMIASLAFTVLLLSLRGLRRDEFQSIEARTRAIADGD